MIGGPLRSKLVLAWLFLGIPGMVSAQDAPNVFDNWAEWRGAENWLQFHLNDLAFEQLERRRQEVRRLQNAEDWRKRQQVVRDRLLDLLGPFPEKTPLNARVAATHQREGYRVENIIFESMPDFHVTGSLFIPDGLNGKAPAILNVIGHTGIAYRSHSYQKLILNLVQKGFIVFAIDPVGQGERLQYYSPEQQESLVGGSTTEHSYLGRQCFLTGTSPARYFTWDGVRALDYLESRPEVDPERLGVTGISGGGTQTSYIAAVDERVRAAAPANYICGFHRLFESIGPQDAEQNLFEGVAKGIDHADFLEVRAPRPTLVVATTRDFFSIQGAREMVAEASRAFEALGEPDHLAIAEDDHGHGYTTKTREAIYSFFQEHLGQPGDSEDREVEYLTMPELQVTRTGQLIGSIDGETVFSLNKAYAAGLVKQLDVSRAQLSARLANIGVTALEMAGVRTPTATDPPVFRGRHPREGFDLELYGLKAEGPITLPVYLLRPSSEQVGSVLLLDSEGKAAALRLPLASELASRGYLVLIPDLSGMGELGQVSNGVNFLGVQVGRSVVGVRASEILICLRFLQEESGSDRFVAVARGGVAAPLLHAALLKPGLQDIVLIESLVSYRSMVESEFYRIPFADVVPGALTEYDLPDLQAALAPRRVMMVNPVNALLKSASEDLLKRDLWFVREAFESKGRPEAFSVHQWQSDERVQELVLSVLEN